MTSELTSIEEEQHQHFDALLRLPIAEVTGPDEQGDVYVRLHDGRSLHMGAVGGPRADAALMWRRIEEQIAAHR